jgi:hypothetical protein
LGGCYEELEHHVNDRAVVVFEAHNQVANKVAPLKELLLIISRLTLDSLNLLVYESPQHSAILASVPLRLSYIVLVKDWE